MKVLVTIANHGIKNTEYLNILLKEYRSMQFEKDIVVLSDIPKELGSDIEVIVGCPSKDPWSLPFGHKKIFVERENEYDLFIYSEDDTLIKENNIQGFLEVSAVLPENEIAGFLRYETDSSGNIFYSTINSHFRWVPPSVHSINKYTFARFTNDHSACYMLTRKQLNKAIASGGFLVEPHQEKYDLLVTAATDPYTQCGFTKMICISHLDVFCLHHLPNRYLGKMGVPSKELRWQIDALLKIASNEKLSEQLFQGETKLKQGRWSKTYYESSRDDLIDLIPSGAKTVLSVGCGWGTTETRIVDNGMEVIAVPVDSVMEYCAQMKGVKTTPAIFGKALDTLAGQRFDCIIFSGVLEHLPNPRSILSRFADLLVPDGVILLSAPNFNHVSVWRDILSGKISWEQKRDFDKSRIHFTTKRKIERWLREIGVEPFKIVFGFEDRYQRLANFSFGIFSGLFASNMIIVGTKKVRRK
jgi:2-polyprenyl-3-methyl-5-hydroxy-6-metoxy-1,4-benzoquinol methylase